MVLGPPMSAPVELLVVRGARAVDPSAELDATVDIVVERGRITRIGPGAGTEPARSERARVIARSASARASAIRRKAAG